MALRILVVEDDADARETLVMLLCALGHDADGREDVASARAALEGGAFDLTLIDYTLPDGTGADVARVARAGEPRPLVVGLTGWAPSHMSPEDREAFDRLAQKPIDTDRLRRLLEEAAPPRASLAS